MVRRCVLDRAPMEHAASRRSILSDARARSDAEGRAALPSRDCLASRGHNWIDGGEAEAASGTYFELTGADGRASLGRWPRSGEPDLDLALDAARAAESGWRALGLGARHDALREVADRLLDAPDPDTGARRALGFTDAEFAVHVRGLDVAAAEGLSSRSPLARGPLGARDGPCLLAPTWSSGWHAPLRTLLYALRAGRPVILAPDGRLPCVGDALRAALAELPRGVFQVLHDDGRTLVRAGALRRDLPTMVVGAERLDADFAGAPHVEIARPRRTTVVVDPAQPLEDQVRRLLDSAIGRARALSGSRSGQVGRVIASDRIFSKVNELVLQQIESSAEAARPLAIAAVSQASALEAALALGLDEGATAVLTGLGGPHRLFPVIFTNVEPAWRIARQNTPCALLLLLRAHDLRSAHAAAARLDQEVRS